MELSVKQRQRGGDLALPDAQPKGSLCASGKKPAGIGPPAAVSLLGERERMLLGRAVARMSVTRADAMAVLLYLDRSPIQRRKLADQRRHHRGLTDVPSVPADHHSFHTSESSAGLRQQCPR